MNRTIKEATIKRYHYDSHRQLETHLHDFKRDQMGAASGHGQRRAGADRRAQAADFAW